MKNPMFAFAACLRHAFMAGAGYGEMERISEADQRRWVEYDPPNVGSFKTIADVIAASEPISDLEPPKRTTTGVVIVAAAVRVNGAVVLSVPAPGRHHNIINAEFFPSEEAYVEGFLTSAGTFVDRENALELAIKAGQFNAPAEGKRELFSEDLW